MPYVPGSKASVNLKGGSRHWVGLQGWHLYLNHSILATFRSSGL